MTYILVVEDDDFTRSGIRTSLESLGYLVQGAENVKLAWDMVQEQPPNTAIIDIHLPLNGDRAEAPDEPHGIALASRFKELFPTLPIILLSAHHKYEQEIIQMAQRYVRSIAFLHKGGDMRRLRMAIEEVQAGHTIINGAIANKYVVEAAVSSQFGEVERTYIEQAAGEFSNLTPREQEIAHLIAASHTPESVADLLFLSKSSVENRITVIYRKLGLADMKANNRSLRQLPVLVKSCLLYDIKNSK